MKPVLAVDIDSTIYEFSDSLIESTKELKGDTITKEEISDWYYLQKRYGNEEAEEIFIHALAPEKVAHRELYPGCKSVLDTLRQTGVELHFISHNHNPDGMNDAVREWLAPKFPLVPVDILHSSEPKLDKLLELDALGILDDKPETLEAVADAGLIAATLIHPWNQKLVNERPDIMGFRRWKDVWGLGLFEEIAARQRAKRTV